MANIAIDWEKYEEDLSRVLSQPQAGQWSTVISLTGQKYEGYYLGVTNDQMHEVFKEWNEGELDSYLIEITRDILGYKDEDGKEVVDLILDTAGQKGTGKWTAISALDLGQPLTLSRIVDTITRVHSSAPDA